MATQDGNLNCPLGRLLAFDEFEVLIIVPLRGLQVLWFANESSWNPHRHDHVQCAAVGIVADESVRPACVKKLEPDMLAP